MSPVSSRDGRLHAAMAGRGNPYAVLTEDRLPLVRAIFDDSVLDAAARLGISADVLVAELAPLVTAGLLERRSDWYAPRFVIVDAGEVRRVDAHARVLGRLLAARLLSRWDTIEAASTALADTGGRGLTTPEFLLVGDRILDIGLLDALAAQGSLMPPAPARSTPGDPDAHYYLWMIEGERADLGQYGQRTTALPWPGWELLTFGRYAETGALPTGSAREELEARALELAATHQHDGPSALANALDIPQFDRTGATVWKHVAAEAASDLLGVYLQAEPELRFLWSSLRAASARPAAFGEFLCWYDHVAYAHAIDELVAAGAFALPDVGYAAALWQEPENTGAF